MTQKNRKFSQGVKGVGGLLSSGREYNGIVGNSRPATYIGIASVISDNNTKHYIDIDTYVNPSNPKSSKYFRKICLSIKACSEWQAKAKNLHCI